MIKVRELERKIDYEEILTELWGRMKIGLWKKKKIANSKEN